MQQNSPQPFFDPAVIAHSQLMSESYRHWLNRELISELPSPSDLAEALYQAPFVLVSHGMEADPLFNYANITAQTLWSLDWPHFVGMPSRHSAEPGERAQRSQALSSASQVGFTSGYTGIRISSQGRRFRILDGVIWNLLDNEGIYRGQAASFSRWEYL
jgi:hypothetical protein